MIKLSAAYSKKAGLPAFSSHAFYLSVETELQNLEDVSKQSEQLYRLLQESVDKQIEHPGFVPPNGYGLEENGRPQKLDAWQCSEKQRDLISKIIRENGSDHADVERLANDLFGKELRSLNKLEASGLIDRLLEKNGNGNGSRRGRRVASTGGGR